MSRHKTVSSLAVLALCSSLALADKVDCRRFRLIVDDNGNVTKICLGPQCPGDPRCTIEPPFLYFDFAPPPSFKSPGPISIPNPGAIIERRCMQIELRDCSNRCFNNYRSDGGVKSCQVKTVQGILTTICECGDVGLQVSSETPCGTKSGS